MWWLTSRRKHYRTIPKEAEKAILALARRYPGLSQNGLQDEIERMGVHADPHELKLFLRDHGRKIVFPGFRRRGQWDTGWPTWTYTNPAGDIEWPVREPFEYRFPFGGWSFKQPLWFRLLLAVPVVAFLGYLVYWFVAHLAGG